MRCGYCSQFLDSSEEELVHLVNGIVFLICYVRGDYISCQSCDFVNFGFASLFDFFHFGLSGTVEFKLSVL